MSNVDTSSWEEFRLDELFEKIKTEKIAGKANDFPTCRTDEYRIPLLTAGADNQGFARYAKRNQCPAILKKSEVKGAQLHKITGTPFFFAYSIVFLVPLG